MLVATKGRYALKILIDITKHKDEGFVSAKDISNRQNISLKYISKILSVYVKDGVLETQSGKGGGYKLQLEPKEYNVGYILRLAEGELFPTSCLGCGGEVCNNSGECPTYPMWEKFFDITNDYFNNITLEDFIKDKEKEISNKKEVTQ